MTTSNLLDQPRLRLRRGFTLIELVIVACIVGMLAAVALPRLGSTQRKAHTAAMRADLRSLGLAQEMSAASRGVYLDDVSQLQFSFSPGVELVGAIVVTPGGWSARVQHPQLSPETCAVFYGSAAPIAPAVSEGVVACGR